MVDSTDKALQKDSLIFFTFSIKLYKDITNRTSKNVYRVFGCFVHTNFGKSAFYYKSTSIWNSLMQPPV